MPNYRNPNKALERMIEDFKGLLQCQIEEADKLLKDPESIKNARRIEHLLDLDWSAQAELVRIKRKIFSKCVDEETNSD